VAKNARAKWVSMQIQQKKSAPEKERSYANSTKYKMTAISDLVNKNSRIFPWRSFPRAKKLKRAPKLIPIIYIPK